MLVVIATSRGGGKKMGGSLFKMKEGGNNRYSHRFLILLLFTYIQQMGIYVYAYNISDFLHFFFLFLPLALFQSLCMSYREGLVLWSVACFQYNDTRISFMCCLQLGIFFFFLLVLFF